MRSAMRAAHNVRLAAFLAVGAFALHQLRYLLVPSAELAQQAHGYTTDLLPPVALLALAAVLARALEVIERAIAIVHAERRGRARPPAVRGRPLPARGPRLSSSPLAFGLARRPPPVLA